MVVSVRLKRLDQAENVAEWEAAQTRQPLQMLQSGMRDTSAIESKMGEFGQALQVRQRETLYREGDRRPLPAQFLSRNGLGPTIELANAKQCQSIP